jgi:hypothetical protein
MVEFISLSLPLMLVCPQSGDGFRAVIDYYPYCEGTSTYTLSTDTITLKSAFSGAYVGVAIVGGYE